MHHLSDASLVRFHTRNPDAGEAVFTVLYKRYWSAVFRHARRYTDHYNAEGRVQETFRDFWLRMGAGKTPQPVRAFLFAAVRNNAISFGRRCARRPLYDPAAIRLLQEAESGYAVCFRDSEWWEWVASALSPGELRVFLLRFRDGLNNSEVAECEGIDQGTVRWRIAVGREKLKKLKTISNKSSFSCD